LGFSPISSQALPNIKVLSKQEGLSQASVFAITEDADGFLWLGTRDGLNKYDGYEFKVYRRNENSTSLAGNDVRTLYYDHLSHQIWIGTLDGLSVYNEALDNFKNFKHLPTDSSSISSNHIGAILRDSKGRLWIGTSKGLHTFNEREENFTRHRLSEKPGSNSIEAIFEDSDDNIWIGTREGLFKLETNRDSQGFQRKDIEYKMSGSWITSIDQDSEKAIYVGSGDAGLSIIYPQTKQAEVYLSIADDQTSLSHNDIRDLCIDHKDRIWVGTFKGLCQFDKKLKKFLQYKKTNNPNSIPDNSIKSLYEDRKGSMWIGTYFAGIINIDDRYNQFENFVFSPFEDGLSAEVISAFEEDKEGNLWIGTEGGGLNYYDVSTGKYAIFQASDSKTNTIAGNNIKQVLLTGDSLWIGTFNKGYSIMNLRSGKIENHRSNPQLPHSISNNNVYGFLLEGKNMWILTYGGGLNILDLDSGKYSVYNHDPRNSNGISSDFSRVIMKSKDGNIWIGTSRGLNKVVKNTKGLPARFINFLRDDKIYALAEDSREQIYVGTISNGFYILNPKTEELQQLTLEDGLAGNTVYGILEDDDKFIWLSTNNGISKYDPRTKSFINFNNANGLYNSEFYFNAHRKTASGELLFGGFNGYTRFDPKKIESNQYVPEIVFTDLSQNNVQVDIDSKGLLPKSVDQLQQLEFKYNEANFTLEFAALDFFSPQNNQYAFMLEGLDRTWNYVVGESKATYTIQKAGNYTFRLKGSNSDGVWNPQERTLEIVVLPPPWRTWWAYGLYTLLLLASAYALIRYLKLRSSLKIEKLAKSQQDEIHQMKLKFYTNIAHEFRTPLTLIIGPIEDLIKDSNWKLNPLKKQKLQNVYKNSNRLLNLVNQLMTFRKMETGNDPLTVQEIELNTYLAEIFSLFEDHAKSKEITFKLDLPSEDVKVWIDPSKIEKVIFNLLSNAFKFTEPYDSISLGLILSDKEVLVSVKDTGKGIAKSQHEQIFRRFYEKNTNKTSNLIKGTGVGLSLSRQLVELHKGSLTVTSSEDEGALFRLSLLLGREHFMDSELVDKKNIDLSYSKTMLEQGQKEQYSSIATFNKHRSTRGLKILVVDDNLEIRTYLNSIFSDEYVVISAEDGLDAFEKTKKFMPDIIISDVMMPIMDGIEFSQEIKNNFETSHIPVILLTAKAQIDDKLSGLDSGANDYISKPFHPQELKLKVRNIVTQRQNLKQALKDNRTYSPSEVNLTSADEEFIETFIKLIEENISNPDFKVDQLAHELAVSRAIMFNKIKALTGSTPKNFMKSFRLKRAIQLLESGKISISEIAYNVGFKEPKYFSKVFQKEFGSTPSEYLSQIIST